MSEQSSLEIAPVVTLQRPAPADRSQPGFTSAQILPGRGMMTLQVRAHLPGQGEVDLLEAPPLARAADFFTSASSDFPSNGSYLIGGAFLLPFANRIRGELSADGRTIQARILGKIIRLPANAGGKRQGAERYAMHGLILDARVAGLRRWTTDEQDSVAATLDAGDFQHQWPSKTEVTFENVLTSISFSVALTARNVGHEPLPMGIGWHPYFVLPSGRREQARLRMPARGRALVNDYDEVLPTGEVQSLAGTPYDFSMPGGRPLGNLYLDDCFVDLERTAEGHAVAEVVDPAASYGLRVVAISPHIQAFQVYGPPEKGFIVIEPQFNRADPFGSQWEPEESTGMVIMAPGESVTYSARLELFTP